MVSALLVFLGLAIIFGLLLGYASIRFKVEGNPKADQIDNILPQTQCGQCGFPGCRPYAEALANDESEVNLCVPGGEEVMLQIAEITGREPKEMAETPDVPEGKIVAIIDEDVCIGCVHCIKACPVDAIVGATKLMHTVIESECTGCEKCIPVCPVDCIEMIPVEQTLQTWTWAEPDPAANTQPLIEKFS